MRRAKRLPCHSFEFRQSVSDSRFRFLLVGGFTDNGIKVRKDGIADFQFQNLVLQRIAVGEDVQPQRPGADLIADRAVLCRRSTK